jgi:photosystem II stability/assembly factor-like uncharacterized protein
MRVSLPLLLATTALAQQVQQSHTTESLRGVSALPHRVAWASGTHGTYLRTIDGGATWASAQVPDAASLDFRAVVAFSADEAFLMSAGPGDQSRIYHTTDAGQRWSLQFTNTNPKGFFDSMAFWDAKHGIVLGDPISDESGKLKFELLLTDDGQTWKQIPPSQLPEAMDGEGAFAASNSCIALLAPTVQVFPTDSSTTHAVTAAQDVTWKSGASAPRKPPENDGALAPDIWFATGGKAARVFHSPDHGKSWQVVDTPIVHGPESAGIFSIAFRDALHGVIAGGDYKHPDQDGPNLAFTEDAGKTWTLSQLKPQAYFSAVAYDRKVNDEARRENSKPKKNKIKATAPERLFLVGQDFVFDFRPPANPERISPKKDNAMKFNAVSPIREGGAIIVGAKGAIISIP